MNCGARSQIPTKSWAATRFGVGAWVTLFTILVILPSAVAQTGSPETKWHPIIDNDSVDTNQLFPAEILSLANRPAGKVPARYLGDPNSFLGVVVVSPTSGVHLHVSVKVDRLADESTLDVTIPESNQPYEIRPTIRFDTRALVRIRESFITTAIFSVSSDGVSLGEQTRTVQVRSINDVPFEYLRKDGHAQDVSFLFAAFVDENDPYIDRILHEALRVNAVRQFDGYQGSPQDVIRQVFAIWNVLEREGVRYSSITTPSGQSGSVLSQHVRFLDESVQNAEANCVDGSVLFASVLYKIGIFPVLVKLPGHMFLGFYTDSQHKQISFLETTLIGAHGLNTFQKSWTFKTADGYLGSQSYKDFLYAISYGNSEFQKAFPNIQGKAPGYLVIDVQRARQAGISAIPRF